jgi:hypothetical protein
MPKTKLNIIKPALGVTDMTDGDLLARLNAVHDGMLNNLAYPNPPVDMAGFKAAIDAYTAAAAAALDGGKSAIAERNKRRADAIVMLRLLGTTLRSPAKATRRRLFPAASWRPLPISELRRNRSLHPRS